MPTSTLSGEAERPKVADAVIEAGKGTELANDNVLGGRLQGQGHQNSLNVFPLLDDQVRVELPQESQHHRGIILAWMLESIERCAHFSKNISVAWRELIAEDVEERKIDRVGAVRIRRMNLGLDIGRIVEQEVKHIVTLM